MAGFCVAFPYEWLGRYCGVLSGVLCMENKYLALTRKTGDVVERRLNQVAMSRFLGRVRATLVALEMKIIY